jgi:hypothetical protein
MSKDMTPATMVALCKANAEGRFVITTDPATEVSTFRVIVDTKEAVAKFPVTDGVTAEVGKPNPANKLTAKQLYMLAQARGFGLKESSFNVKRSTTLKALQENAEWNKIRQSNPDFEKWFEFPGSRGSKAEVADLSEIEI